MPTQSTTIHAARVTIEFTTPFHVGTGSQSDGSDAGVVTDANGLPALPGSSLQGALRSACAEAMGDHHILALFGRSDQQVEPDRPAHAARLRFSWGHIHDENDKPVAGFRAPEVLALDEVLDDALHPTLRDHVRMTHRKVADTEEHGKFDELAVSAGHRFTFDLVCTNSDGSLSEAWAALLDVIQAPTTRFGGKTRRGFGAFKLIRLWQHNFDLSDPVERKAWLSHSQELNKDPGQEKTQNSTAPTSISLTPETPWMIGGGSDPDADSAPVRDTRIVWNGNSSEIQECFVIPGSSVKGALSHRTCFHANRLAKNFADKMAPEDFKNFTGENNDAVKALFGNIANEGDDGQEGTPGIVFIDDVFLPVSEISQLPAQNHVAIDPFTGGAKDTALFQDRPLAADKTPAIKIPVSIRESDTAKLDADTRKAFLAALDDLCAGRLALGAHSGRGYGFFSGSHDIALGTE